MVALSRFAPVLRLWRCRREWWGESSGDRFRLGFQGRSLLLWAMLCWQVLLQMSVPAPAQDNSGQEMLRYPGVSIRQCRTAGAYFVQWLPSDIDERRNGGTPVLVTLPGSHGKALAELRDWYQYARQRGSALVALQWWLGGESYLSVREVFALIDNRLSELMRLHPSIMPGGNMIHGFSRGATYIPALALLDRQEGRHWFCTFVLNSGAWPPNNPPPYMLELFDPRDRQAFAGQHFIAYYGKQDEEWGDRPATHGRLIKEMIEEHGGVYDEFFVLAEGKHGTFMRTPCLVNQSLDCWLRRRSGAFLIRSSPLRE